MTGPSTSRQTRRASQWAIGAVALVAMVGLSSCSNESHERVSTPDTTAVGQSSDTGGEATGDCRTGADAADAAAPDLAPPAAPATELGITDEIEGCGAAIPVGAVSDVTVNYVGKSESTGEVFDSSFDRGQPASFPVGAGRLIAGWDQGLVGMKEGGRRILLVPGSLAYGPQGNPPDIGPDDTLVFAIDLISIDG